MANNNILLTRAQIKYQLENIRNHDFPDDNQFTLKPHSVLSDLTTNGESSRTQFCLENISYIDCDDGKIEKIMIFNTDFQLNLLSNSTHLYLDGTFKCPPHNFYQLLTINSFNQLILFNNSSYFCFNDLEKT